ncbi:hypothetical protein BJ508DRAFT_381609 [Ascobolus immersus RN42]|uniref:Uncharacterized protein n=1 Tax=Ascobolus immersus RN42 TaxID=1160509 RepID=A0A3N4HDH7_ASCIM|nr:hypothetical protein BJ508DRAFT_381609 [Ascobolus immersus RN42]
MRLNCISSAACIVNHGVIHRLPSALGGKRNVPKNKVSFARSARWTGPRWRVPTAESWVFFFHHDSRAGAIDKCGRSPCAGGKGFNQLQFTLQPVDPSSPRDHVRNPSILIPTIPIIPIPLSNLRANNPTNIPLPPPRPNLNPPLPPPHPLPHPLRPPLPRRRVPHQGPSRRNLWRLWDTKTCFQVPGLLSQLLRALLEGGGKGRKLGNLAGVGGFEGVVEGDEYGEYGEFACRGAGDQGGWTGTTLSGGEMVVRDVGGDELRSPPRELV